jgi:hypothetical protein
MKKELHSIILVYVNKKQKKDRVMIPAKRISNFEITMVNNIEHL